MDHQTLIDIILREARKDCFNGVGRIFKKHFLQTHGVNEETFLKTIELMQRLWKGIEIKPSSLNDDIFLVYLGGSKFER